MEAAPAHVYRRRRAVALAVLVGLVAADRARPARARRRRRGAGRQAASPTARRRRSPPTLPRGGRSIFPEHRVVAYYGAPQRRRAGRARHRQPGRRGARRSPARPRPYARKGRPVLPALELIAVIANADAGDDGLYLTPPDRRGDPPLPEGGARRRRRCCCWTSSPGRSDFFTETRRLEKWLREPDVGLALDPEWHVGRGRGAGPGDRERRLARGQRHDRVAGPAERRARPAGEARRRPPVHRRHGRRHDAASRATGCRSSSTPTASARRP